MKMSPLLVYSICEYNIGRRDLFLQSSYDIRLMMFDLDQVKDTLLKNGKIFFGLFFFCFKVLEIFFCFNIVLYFSVF